MTWIACTVATIVCLPLAPRLFHDLRGADSSSIAWTVYLRGVSEGCRLRALGYALRRTTAGRLGSMTYLVPPIAIAFGWAFLGETPPLLAVVGGALCLAGVVLARR